MTTSKVGLTIDQVNYLNIGLMVASAAIALRWPFETFLLAYIVLGPLHYLTEISWLHDRHYFTRRKHDYLMLVAAAGLVVGEQLAAQPALDRLIGTFLPTIIHVFIFTGLFILVGTLRARSASGALSLVVFVGAAM